MKSRYNTKAGVKFLLAPKVMYWVRWMVVGAPISQMRKFNHPNIERLIITNQSLNHSTPIFYFI